ncbi:MAG: hypothetical protein KAG98_05150 [Lentisphaeria bacterium]|nr:hypothetical protein [Lentisphaeria bacterium]
MSAVFEFVNLSLNAVLLIDEPLKIKASSKLIYAMFGLPSLISGRKKLELNKLFHGQAKLIENITHCTEALSRTGSQCNFTWRFKGKIYFVSIVSIRIDKVRHFSINFEDVSYKYKVDSHLELTRAYLSDILNNLPIGVIVLDENQHIYMLNTKQLEFFKRRIPDIELEHCLGFQLSECLSTGGVQYWEPLVKSYLAGHSKAPLQTRYTYEKFVYSCTISSFALTGDKNKAIMVISEDITEAHALEQKLKISEEKATQLKTLKEINVSLRHEIFNVVTPLSMNAELLKVYLDPVDQVAEVEMVDSILESTERLIDFVKQLIDIKEVVVEDYIDGDESSMITY